MKKSRSPAAVEEIRRKILDAALSLISAEGFSALTMRALAKRLDMSAPNLYNFFASKDEIYITLVIQGFTLLHETMQKAAKENADPLERGRAMALAYLDFGMNQPAHYEIMFTSRTPKHDDYVGTPLESLADIELDLSMKVAGLATQAAAGIAAARPTATPVDVADGVIHVWSLLHGMVSLRNSGVMAYVATDPPSAYHRVLDGFRALYSGPVLD